MEAAESYQPEDAHGGLFHPKLEAVPMPENTSKAISLRTYQKNAVSSVLREFKGDIANGKEPVKKTLCVMATGTGKSLCIAELVRRAQINNHPVLVMVHRKELIEQLAEKINRFGVPTLKERAEESAMAGFGDPPFGVANVVIGSTATLRGDRLLQWPRNSFKLIIGDESHHIISPGQMAILEHFGVMDNHTRLVGFTATADRLDGKGLIKAFDSLAYEYNMESAINDPEGPFLAKPVAYTIETDPPIDLKDLRIVAGDFNKGDLEKKINDNIGTLVNALVDSGHLGNKKFICFTPDVSSAHAVAAALGDVGIIAKAVSGKTDDTERAETINEYKTGVIQGLINCMIFTEGFDAPETEAIVILRPTKSRALYCLDEQTEILTESGWKRDVEIGKNVAAFDPVTQEITFTPAIAKVRRPLEPHENWVSIQGPSVDIRVTDNHRMLYDNKKRHGWKIKLAGDLAKMTSGCYLPQAGFANKKGVPLTDSEIRFIGWVMSDGTINKRNGAITITQGEHQPWLEEIQSAIDGCGFKSTRSVRKRVTQHNQTSDAVCWIISKGKPRGRDSHLRGWGELAPFLSKDMSPMLNDMSAAQFEVLAEALHMGDGHKQAGQTWTRRSYHIATGNKVMADRLQILGTLNGWRSSVAQYSYNENPLYCVHLKKQNWSSVGSQYDDRPIWQTDKMESGDMCWCVQNEVGTLVTRRNGKVAIVGNSQMVGRGSRLKANGGECSVIDFAYMTGTHQLVSAVDLYDNKDIDDAVIDRARQLVKEGNRDPKEAIEAAQGEFDLSERVRIERRVAKLRVKTFDLVTTYDLLGMKHKAGQDWGDTKAATPKMIQFAQKCGVDLHDDAGFGTTKKILDTLSVRRKYGLATIKQVAACIRLSHQKQMNVRPEEFRKMKFEEASAFISENKTWGN